MSELCMICYVKPFVSAAEADETAEAALPLATPHLSDEDVREMLAGLEQGQSYLARDLFDLYGRTMTRKRRAVGSPKLLGHALGRAGHQPLTVTVGGKRYRAWRIAVTRDERD